MDGGNMTSGAVHVWTIELDAEPAIVSSMLELLSGEERVRSARLRTTQQRLRFVMAHGAIRSILGQYLGRIPNAIEISTHASGKPYVQGSPLAFNVAYSEAVGVCAVVGCGQIGVDVERIRRVDDQDSIVKRYFAPGEVRQYEALPAVERATAFFSTWTRKEAVVKAGGSGLHQDLQSFEVEVAPHAIRPRLTTGSSENWTLRAFAPRPHYLAAVALDREIDTLEFFEWSRSGVGQAAEAQRARTA
jgi:4'-phosphopantetheinyl transferase